MNGPTTTSATLLEYRLSLPDVLKVLPDGELLHEPLWVYGIRHDTTNGRTPKTKVFDEGVFVPRSISSSATSDEDDMPSLLSLEDAQSYILGCILNHSDDLKLTRLANWIQRTQTRQKKLAQIQSFNYHSHASTSHLAQGNVDVRALSAVSAVPVSLLCDTHESMVYVAAVRDDTEWDAPVPPLVWRAIEDRFRKEVDRFTQEYLGETVTGKWVLTDTSTEFKIGSTATAIETSKRHSSTVTIMTTPPCTPMLGSHTQQKRQPTNDGKDSVTFRRVDIDIGGLSPIQPGLNTNNRASFSGPVGGAAGTAVVAFKSSPSAPSLPFSTVSDDDEPLVILTRTPLTQPLGPLKESEDHHPKRSLDFEDEHSQFQALSPSTMASLQRLPSVVRDELVKHHKQRKGVPSTATKQFIVRLYLVAICPIPPPLMALWLEDLTQMCRPAVVTASLGAGTITTPSSSAAKKDQINNNYVPPHLDLSPSAKQQLSAKGLPYISCPKAPEKVSVLPLFGKCVDWRFFLIHVLRGASKHDFEQRRQALNELLLEPSWELIDEIGNEDDNDKDDLKDVAITDQMEDDEGDGAPLNPKLALKALEGRGKRKNLAATVVVREHVPLAALHSTKLEHILKYGIFSILETHSAQSSLDSGVAGVSAACTVAESVGGKGQGGFTTRGGAKWSLLADDGGGEIFRATEAVNDERIGTDDGKNRYAFSSSNNNNNTTKKYARIVGSRGTGDCGNGSTRSASILVELQLEHGVVTGTFVPDANLFIMASLNQELFGYTIKENNIAIALMPSSKRSDVPTPDNKRTSLSGSGTNEVEKSAKPMYTVELQHTTLFPYDASASLYCTKQSMLFISTIDGKVVAIPGGNLKSENVALRGTIEGWGVPSHVVTLLESPTTSLILPTTTNNINVSFSNMGAASSTSFRLAAQSSSSFPPQPRQRQKPLREPIVSLATVPKFSRLICGSLMGSVASIRNGRVDGMLPGVEERPGGVLCIITMPDLHTIATCGHSPTIHLWTMAFQHSSTSTGTSPSLKSKTSTQRNNLQHHGTKASSDSSSSSCLVGQLRDSGNPHASPIVFLWRAPQDDVSSDCRNEARVFRERLLSVDVVGTVKLWDLGLQCCIVTCAQRTPMHVLSCQVVIGSTRRRREYLVAQKVTTSSQSSVSYPVGTEEIAGYNKRRPTTSSPHFPDYSSVVVEEALKAATLKPSTAASTSGDNARLGAVLHGLGGTESTVRLVVGEADGNNVESGAPSSLLTKPSPAHHQRRKSLGAGLAIQTPGMADGENSENQNHYEHAASSTQEGRGDSERSISVSGATTTNSTRPAGLGAEVVEEDLETDGANHALDIRVKLCVVNTAAFRLEIHEVAVKLNESGHFDGSDDKVQQIIVGGATSVAIAEQALIKAAERNAKIRRGGPTAAGLSQSNKQGRNLIQVGYSLGDSGGSNRMKQFIRNIPRQVATIFMNSINAYVAVVNDSIVIIDSKSKEVEGRYTGICEQYMMEGKFLGTVDDAQASDMGPLAAAAAAASSTSTAKSKPPNVVVTATAVSDELRTLFVGCEGGSDVLAVSVSTGSVQARLRMNTLRTNQRIGFPTAILAIASTESNAQIAAAAALDSAHNNNASSTRSKRCTVIVGSSTGIVALFLVVPSAAVSGSNFSKKGGGAAADESGGGVLSMDERATAEIIVPAHQITASHCSITRFGWHAISRILAMGDAEGNFTQWEVFSNQLSKCTTLKQPDILFSNQSRHMRSSSYQSQQESDNLASGKKDRNHETEIENASALISHITRKQHERDQQSMTITNVNSNDITTPAFVPKNREDNKASASGTIAGGSVEASKLNLETDQFLYGLFTGEGRYEITAISSLAPFFGFVVADSSGKCRVWTTTPYDAAAVIFEWTPRVDKHSPSGGIPIPTALVLESNFDAHTPSSVFPLPPPAAISSPATDRTFHEQRQQDTPTHNAPPQTFLHVVDDQGIYSCWSLTSALTKSGLAFDVALKCEEAAATPKIKQLISPARSRLISATQLLRKKHAKQVPRVPTSTVASSAMSLLRATRDAAAMKRRCVVDLLRSGDGSTITDSNELLTRFPSLHARIAVSPSASDCPAVSIQLTHTGTDGILLVVGLGTGDTILLRPATNASTASGSKGAIGSSTANTPVMGGGTRPVAPSTYNNQQQLRFGYLHPLQAKKGPVFEIAPVGRLADFGGSSSGVFSFSESMTNTNLISPKFASFAKQDSATFGGGDLLSTKKPPRATKKGATRAAVGVTLHCQLPAPPASPTNTVDVFPRHRITSALDAGSAHRTIANSNTTATAFSPPRTKPRPKNQHTSTPGDTRVATHINDSELLVDTMDETQTMSNSTFLSQRRTAATTRYLTDVCDRLRSLIEVGDDTFNLLVNPPSKFFDPQMTSALSAPPASALGGHAGPVVEEDNIREGNGVRPNVSHIINAIIASTTSPAKKEASSGHPATNRQPWMFTIVTDSSLFNSLPPLRDLSSHERGTALPNSEDVVGDRTVDVDSVVSAQPEKGNAIQEEKNHTSHRHTVHIHQRNLGSIKLHQSSSSSAPVSKKEAVVEEVVRKVVEVGEQQSPHDKPFSETLDFFKIKPQSLAGVVQQKSAAATTLSSYSKYLLSRPDDANKSEGVKDDSTYCLANRSAVDQNTLTTSERTSNTRKYQLRRSLIGQACTTTRPNSAASSTFLMKMLNGRDHDVSIGPSSTTTSAHSTDAVSSFCGELSSSPTPPITTTMACNSAVRRGSPDRKRVPYGVGTYTPAIDDGSSFAVAVGGGGINSRSSINITSATTTTPCTLKRRPMSAAVAGRHLEADANTRRGRINMHLK